ncbi:DUF805 domain-containing protein [Sphingomonas sp.]|uniref:DUF805 domain-containing protein n=1 Tax=Sphingomonas sp. TaxID=28214 RepID=UPI002ED9C760
MRWALLPYRRYFEFRGRSRRIEFWAFFLWWLIASIVLRLIEGLFGLDALAAGLLLILLFMLGSFIPGLAVTVRRLHDANRTGWWALLPFTTFFLAFAAVAFGVEEDERVSITIGTAVVLCPLALLVMLAWKGTRGPNRFGEDPDNPDIDLEAVFG